MNRTMTFLALCMIGMPQMILAAQFSNESGTISISGADAFALAAPRSQVPEVFAVRVVDTQGKPVPSLTVTFLTNYEFCIPMAPECSVPEDSVYGHFANDANNVDVLTDADGVATAPYAYIGGIEPGTYTVMALVALSESAANAAFIKNGFDLFIPFTINQNFAASPTLDGYMSGNWYDPEQSGQGFQLEFTDQADTAIAIWFTFAPDGSGQQNWIYAQGPYDRTLHTVSLSAVLETGARFPPAFQSSDVTQTFWGTLTFTLTDCDHGTASWDSILPQYGMGSMPITRLTSIRGAPCPL
jgi:hypothetical protein